MYVLQLDWIVVLIKSLQCNLMLTIICCGLQNMEACCFAYFFITMFHFTVVHWYRQNIFWGWWMEQDFLYLGQWKKVVNLICWITVLATFQLHWSAPEYVLFRVYNDLSGWAVYQENNQLSLQLKWLFNALWEIEVLCTAYAEKCGDNLLTSRGNQSCRLATL